MTQHTITTTNWYATPPLERFNVPNDKVAVEPFPKEEASVVNGVMVYANAAALKALTVIFSSPDYKAGDKVYLSKTLAHSLYSKNKFEVDGKTFILVPKGEVLLHERTGVLTVTVPFQSTTEAP